MRFSSQSTSDTTLIIRLAHLECVGRQEVVPAVLPFIPGASVFGVLPALLNQTHDNRVTQRPEIKDRRERCAPSYLEGIDNSEVVTLGVSGQGPSPHVCHLLFTLRQTHGFSIP